MSIQLGRLVLPLSNTQWSEPVGDPIGALGGTIVAAQRTPYQVQLAAATVGQGTTLSQAQTFRRQLRSLLNNTPLKNLGGLYIIYSLDSEQNGWYVPDAGMLTPIDEHGWQAVGLWQLTGVNWDLAGHLRNFREGKSIWMKDLRTGNFERDYLQLVLSTDFANLPALQLTALPNGASSVINSVNGQGLAPISLPSGRDGGTCQLVTGLPDLACASYDRTEAQMNLSDVIVYDRMGTITAPATGADPGWAEFYGPDWPYNWMSGGANDAPVLDNGLVRVRYDASVGKPGFRVDVWNGSAYVEQGKMVVERLGDSTNFNDTWVASNLVEYTPDRAVAKCILSAAADAYSREIVYITVVRGELGATFECYPAPKAAGTASDVALVWTPALNSGTPDLNEGVAKVDSQGSWSGGSPNSGTWSPGVTGTAAYAATAGTGAGTGNSGQFGSGATTLGNANFTSSENWLTILRFPTTFNVVGAYQTTLVVQQAANADIQYKGTSGGSATAAYGTASDVFLVNSQNTAGYLQVQVLFGATVAQQVLETESMTLGTNTTNTTDAAASNGHAATATRTTDANAHATQATWPNSFSGVYRVFARVKVSANSASFYVKTGATTGGTFAGMSTTSYRWIDLGEVTANASTMEIHAWMSGGAGTVSVDRIEAVLVQDRVRTSAIYSGSRDQAQAALYDSRTLGTLVTRGT